MKSARFLLLLLGTVMLFAIAVQSCSSNNEQDSYSQTDVKCKTELDCPLDYICYNGKCVLPDEPCGGCPQGKECNIETGKCATTNCQTNEDCERPGICDTATGVCKGEPDKPENCNPPCSDDTVCLNGQCTVPPCRSNEDCKPNEHCTKESANELFGECEEFSCFLDSECRDGWVCDKDSRVCTPPCNIDEDCGAGKQCRSGHCENLPPECDNDYDCIHKKICDEYQQCVRGPNCDPEAENASEVCGENRICDADLHRCVPFGCADDQDCEQGICDPETHECVNKVPTGGGCVDDTQCLASDICYDSICQRLCDPYESEDSCTNGYLCAVIKSGQHLGEGKGVCKPFRNGAPAGVVCQNDNDCEVNLLCIESVCSKLCNPNSSEDDWGCQSNQYCTISSTYGVGICVPRPCDDETNPCPNNLKCIDGKCVECNTKEDCPEHKTCQEHTCKPDCTLTGCEDGFCNAQTGLCESFCMPPCKAWEECINGACVETHCDPPCEDGYYCYHGECKPIECVQQGQACGALADIPGAPCCEGMTCCELFQGSGGYCCYSCNADGTCAE